MASTTPTTKPVQGTTISTDQWAVGLINQLNTTRPSNAQIPVTANNVNNLKLWLAQEQNASSWAADMYNPLGVRNGSNGQVTPYASVQDGIAGTAHTLNNGYYGNILSSLQANAPTQAFATAVIQSPWSGKTYAQRGLNAFLSHAPLNASASTDKANAAGSSGHWYDGIPGSGVVANVVGGVTGTVGGVVSTANAVGNLASNLTSASFWKRIGIFAGGFALFGVGITLFTLNTKTAQTAISAAATKGMI